MERKDNCGYIREILERKLDLPLSLGDRMIIRETMQQVAQEHKTISRYSPSTFCVWEETVARYLGKFYGIEMNDSLIWAITNFSSQKINDRLREKRTLWERD